MRHALAPHQKPAVEKLLDSELVATTWPAEAGTPAFVSQLEAQRFVLESFRSVMETLPIGMNPLEAVDSGRLDETSANTLYQGLAEYLERESAHGRLALFLPFELTAPVGSKASVALTEVNRRFQRAYRTAFERLLREHEVRANFTDGDVLEAELRDRDHPRVVKATHLIPGLIASGHLSVAEAKAYAERSSDPLLRRNIADTLRVHTIDGETVPGKIGTVEPVGDTLTWLERERERIATFMPKQSTPVRTAWLRLDMREKAEAQAAKTIATWLQTGNRLPKSDSLKTDILPVAVDAVRIAGLADLRVYERHTNWLETLRNHQADAALTDAVVKLHAHLQAVGTVDEETLAQWDIRLPKLGGPLSGNLAPLTDFLTEVEGMCKAIVQHPYLGDRVFPVTLVFGSQLKGYGRTNADADVAVFIKPEVGRHERERLEAELARIFSHEKIGGKAVLFWLEERADGLAVIDWPDFAHSDGESNWIHVLFGAAWTGDAGSILHLHRTLLTRYFRDPGTLLHGKPTRERWLEEMERDTVLYRLLHKGYERYFPIQSLYAGITAIDGDSAFYDPRFRRLATELYLGRVFLPLVT